MKRHIIFIFTGLLLFSSASAMGPGGKPGGGMQKSGESMIQESPLVRAMLEINLSEEQKSQMKEVMQDSKEERPNGMLKQNSANLSQMVSSAGFDSYTYIQVSLKDIQESTTKKAVLYSKLINILTPLQRMQLKYALEDLSKTSNDQGPPRL